ncbi:MAG: isoleucine--tRNA ligase [Deltaproteobacteria bacterium]|nr:isoleucine--tRNA ligase [Deltaproteobacteria bacterium]
MELEKDYKDTLNLPKTDFPMKANLAQKEPEALKFWEEKEIYRKMIEARRGRPLFIHHDGPPYANGHIHSGHVLNKVLKDIVVKYKNLSGFCCDFVPGWDCHGLPIEHSVEKELGKAKGGKTPGEIRKKCREFAAKFVDIQREEFKRLGVFGDWNNPYLTMNYGYEAATVREFARFVERGVVYRGRKPVYWCDRCRTALAEAEVEYKEIASPSIFVRFGFKTGFDEKIPELKGKKGSAVIWTTTPWTLPANLAIAFHPEFDYAAEEINGEVLIFAEGLRESFHKETGLPEGKIIAKFKGSALEGAVCGHPFIERDSVIILADFVTLDTGSGCVHIAPGHGQEDYEVGLKYGLDVYAPVDAEGKFTKDVPQFTGRNVFECDPDIIKLLDEKGALIKADSSLHQYPHCWRSKNPVIFRATSQWFISVDKKGLRKNALGEIEKVKWLPSWGLDRIRGMLENRPDWCISRQRVWGNPIIAFHCENCGEYILDAKLVNGAADIFEKEGTDAWFARPAGDFLPEGFECPSCRGREFKKEFDILDVWFDSGVSYAAVIEKLYGHGTTTDLYLEGSDQHRGWFQSSLLASAGTRDQAPYRTVLTHGFVVDGQGRKQSKSEGNYFPHDKIVNKDGAEVLRLWVAAEDYREDIRLSETIISRLVEAYRKFRNTFRFMLGNLYDFDPDKDRVEYKSLAPIDRWALHRLQKVIERVRNAYEDYEFHVIHHTFNEFFTVDLSAFYLDILKDRLYCSGAGDKSRRAAQTVIYDITHASVVLFAPILSFTCEEVYQNLRSGSNRKDSVFLCEMPGVNRSFCDEGLAGEFEILNEVRSSALKNLEIARVNKEIGHSLEAALNIKVKAGSGHAAILKKYGDDLALFFIVSSVETSEIRDIPETFAVSVKRAAGGKCQRCWNYSTSVGKDAGYADCCPRCADVLRRSGIL